ncbi:class I SAM-dependent methyltransferase [Lapillicoccus sp.]|uniref:class I SAM-dependent methyltransferase n=1 Tax=Lapillicoccus sp. TaxID=1909287 RepID=UPI0032662FF0
MAEFTPPDRVTASGDSLLQTQTLESVASAENYHAWLTSLAMPYLGDSPVELGSGLGDYAQTWLDQGVPSVTVTEVDESRLSHLRSRFGGDDRVSVTAIDVFRPELGDHSAFVGFNVLEHIEADAEALRAAHTLVRPGGAVIMLVPAFNFALGQFDREVGHHRRYTKASLTSAYQRAGLTVETMTYVNMPGLLAWFVGMRLLRMTPGDGPLLSVWDRFVVPAAHRFEEGHRAPFGQSVFAVGRVPSS